MLKEFMYATDPKNEHLEDKNIQSSTTPQALDKQTQRPRLTGPAAPRHAGSSRTRILKASDTNEHEETKETVLSKTEETKPQMEKKCSCPPQGTLNEIITNGAILFMVWCVTWSFSGPEVLPGGSLFGLLIIFYGAVIGGKLLENIRIPSVPQLPPVLGMLLAGFTVRNVPFLSDHVCISSTMSSTLRNTALTIILVQAGLGLDPQALKHLKGVCLRLSMGPCLIEACSTAVVSHFLMNFPWQWGFLLGFVVSAVSPAVVVPSMLRLQEKGYGFEKGIPTLLIAASSLDDIVAISGFSTCLSIVFSSGGVLNNLLSAFRDVLVGVLVGIVLGMFTRYFPSRDQIRVQKIIRTAWNIFQPLLFGLVGAEVSVTSLKSNAIGENIYCFIVDAQSYSPSCFRSSGSRKSKNQCTPFGTIFEGCDDNSFSSHLDRSSKWSSNYWHSGTQSTYSP
ncbi:sodium/hydrogen exchanger 9B1-like isoform X8 [Pseudorca crassidens]|uniref:sodium/hydrogen exchanger 9B1-like isoform X8 n=1 Tax=Pseudorca crassidens TaxID=82174 RepID=UPI00352F89C1